MATKWLVPAHHLADPFERDTENSFGGLGKLDLAERHLAKLDGVVLLDLP